jgi:Na+/melibiose symporter-like transporter
MNSFYLTTFITILLIKVMHWFPWNALLHRKLYRVEAYILGTLAIIIPAGVNLWIRGDTYAVGIIVGCSIAAGITTVMTRIVDSIAAQRGELQDRRNRD